MTQQAAVITNIIFYYVPFQWGCVSYYVKQVNKRFYTHLHV